MQESQQCSAVAIPGCLSIPAGKVDCKATACCMPSCCMVLMVLIAPCRWWGEQIPIKRCAAPAMLARSSTMMMQLPPQQLQLSHLCATSPDRRGAPSPHHSVPFQIAAPHGECCSPGTNQIDGHCCSSAWHMHIITNSHTTYCSSDHACLQHLQENYPQFPQTGK